MSATQSVQSRQRGVIRCHGNALRLLIPVFAGAAIVLTGTAAHAGTTPVKPYKAKALAPVVAPGHFKVRALKPVVTDARITSLPRTGADYALVPLGGALVLGGVVLRIVARKPSQGLRCAA